MVASEALANLGRRLESGTLHHFAPEELDAILGWMTGARLGPGAELETLIGSPEADPALLWRAYQQLDAILFFDGGLREEAAGVSAPIPDAERRARYRRLMTAFHPDRDPHLADWLTPRSQAILRSYSAFRHGKPGSAVVSVAPTRPPPGMGPRPRHSRRIYFGPGLLVSLRDRLRGVRHLEAKLLATVASLVFLPVLVLYLDRYPLPKDYDFPTDWAANTDGEIPAVTATMAGQGPEDASPAPPAGRSETPGAGPAVQDPDEIEQPSAQEPWEVALAALATRTEGERAAVRDAVARALAAEEIAAIEAAARESTERNRIAREAAAREAAAREAAAREAAAREAAAREAAAREAAAREAAARAAAAREAAAHEAAAREAAAREAAAREAAAREAAAREAAARASAPRDAATREAATRDGSTLEVAAIGAAPMSMTQLRVAALIDGYRTAFENGDIVAFMRHFGPDPRENTNHGRAWFEKNYKDLFAQSWQRKLALDIATIAPTGEGDWKVSAQYDLRVDYLTRPTVLASGSVHYRIQPQAEGWRIDSIDYGN